MKQFLIGLVTIFILGALGVFAFRGATTLMSRLFPSSSPTASESPTPTPTPMPSTSAKPTPKPTAEPIVKNQTKGGLVKGTSTITTTTTTTTTTSHLFLTLIKSSNCPASYLTEVKDIKGDLTVKYSLKDGYSAKVNIWNKDGNELVGNTIVSGQGTLKTISGVDYMKVRVESNSCSSTSDNWLVVTAER